MKFIKAVENDFDLVYNMMLRAREKLFSEKIFQWDERYPKPGMIKNDIIHGYTFLVKVDERIVAFFTSNSICEDNVHAEIHWIYLGDKWVILHGLCVDPIYQN